MFSLVVFSFVFSFLFESLARVSVLLQGPAEAARPTNYCARSGDLDLDLLRLGVLGRHACPPMVRAATVVLYGHQPEKTELTVIRLFPRDAMAQPAQEDRGCVAPPLQQESPC